MNVRSRLTAVLSAVPLGIATNAVFADDASAHVKWFCAFDVAGQHSAGNETRETEDNGH